MIQKYTDTDMMQDTALNRLADNIAALVSIEKAHLAKNINTSLVKTYWNVCKFSISLCSKSCSLYLCFCGRPKNSNVYVSFIISFGCWIIFPLCDSFKIPFLSLLDANLKYKALSICLRNERTFQLDTIHSFS